MVDISGSLSRAAKSVGGDIAREGRNVIQRAADFVRGGDTIPAAVTTKMRVLHDLADDAMGANATIRDKINALRDERRELKGSLNCAELLPT